VIGRRTLSGRDFLTRRALNRNAPWGDQIGGDIVLPLGAGKLAGKSLTRHFGGGSGSTSKTRNARIVNNSPPALCHHAGDHRFAHEEGGMEVGG